MKNLFKLVFQRNFKKQPFEILKSEDVFQIRRYGKMTLAKIDMHESERDDLYAVKKRLEDYVNGNNFKVNKILDVGPEVRIYKEGVTEIGIVIPNEICKGAVPRPIYRRIKLVETPPMQVGILCIEGRLLDLDIKSKGDELKNWIKKMGLKINGPISIFKHDSYLSIPFLQENELFFEVI